MKFELASQDTGYNALKLPAEVLPAVTQDEHVQMDNLAMPSQPDSSHGHGFSVSGDVDRRDTSGRCY